jgi:recombinational DNA repair protein (RecF pathway)
VIAIFVSLFGLYQAMARGTPEYVAFFLPALIMFLYVLWILYASRSRGKVSLEELENTQTLEEIKTVVENPSEKNTSGISRPSTSHSEHTFIRTYSVA